MIISISRKRSPKPQKQEKKEGNFEKELVFLNNSHSLCFDFKKNYNLQSQKYYSKIILEHYNQSNFIENDKNFQKKLKKCNKFAYSATL